jgi:hypothetical protein
MADDWVRHDGSGQPDLPEGVVLRMRFFTGGPGYRMPPGRMGRDWPGWHWRWRRRFGFIGPRRPVCDDPRYAPILAYQFRRSGIQKLREIVRLNRKPAGPEGPVRGPDPAEPLVWTPADLPPADLPKVRP